MSIMKTGIIAIAVFGVIAASASYAQGRSGGQGRGQTPSQMRDSAYQDSVRRDLEDMRARAAERRREAEAARAADDTRRAEAEAGHAAAQARHAAAETHSRGENASAEHERSASSRAEHPPNEQAAPEAFMAEENALNAELRKQRKDLRAENRGGHAPDDDGGNDD
ncbi:MAG: hypothetical protein IIA05_00800 [Proteobacteria bacterium]|nr:hypothetical protein [Pseudomonadota bacterium]